MFEPVTSAKGVTQAMIGRPTEIGRERVWYKIFWMTQADNFAAQPV
jgi:hypothetical protein